MPKINTPKRLIVIIRNMDLRNLQLKKFFSKNYHKGLILKSKVVSTLLWKGLKLHSALLISVLKRLCIPPSNGWTLSCISTLSLEHSGSRSNFQINDTTLLIEYFTTQARNNLREVTPKESLHKTKDYHTCFYLTSHYLCLLIIFFGSSLSFFCCFCNSFIWKNLFAEPCLQAIDLSIIKIRKFSMNVFGDFLIPHRMVRVSSFLSSLLRNRLPHIYSDKPLTFLKFLNNFLCHESR